MTVRIAHETAESLPEYARIPIAFRVETVYRLQNSDNGSIGFLLVEAPVESYVKDYDAIPGEGPLHWRKQWDLSNWGFLAAYDADRRAGGAAVAWKTEGMRDLRGRDEIAALWDIRVHPDYRGSGIGSKLFSNAVEWAQARGCRALRIETQNINVPACRFYARQGCELGAIDRFAYAPELNEIQLTWYKML